MIQSQMEQDAPTVFGVFMVNKQYAHQANYFFLVKYNKYI